MYELGMSNIDGRPVPPVKAATSAQAESVWLTLKETGPIRVERLNPYGYALDVLTDQPVLPGTRVAWLVARNHNANKLTNSRMLWWHMSGGALTIWLTRNWTADQLLAKAHELLSAQHAASNNALLTDTYSSPLRAQRGAAEGER
jgi:hypothetical protein